MTTEKAIEFGKIFLKTIENEKGSATYEFVEMAIKALDQEPCEDAISRQAVLEQIYNWSKDEFLRVTNPFDYLRKRINSIPSVTPQPKIGHWIEEFNDLEGEVRFTCSSCGKYQLFGTDYCYNCGCRMEGVE